MPVSAPLLRLSLIVLMRALKLKTVEATVLLLKPGQG